MEREVPGAHRRSKERRRAAGGGFRRTSGRPGGRYSRTCIGAAVRFSALFWRNCGLRCLWRAQFAGLFVCFTGPGIYICICASSLLFSFSPPLLSPPLSLPLTSTHSRRLPARPAINLTFATDSQASLPAARCVLRLVCSATALRTACLPQIIPLSTYLLISSKCRPRPS